MKNGDKPAYAQSFASDKDGYMFSAIEKSTDFGGLTKREMFAMAAMQGILSSHSVYNPSDHVRDITEAIECADELLHQLES